MPTSKPTKPRRTITGRALVLGTLIVLLLVLLASPLNRYFNSRSALNDASHQLQSDRTQLKQAQQQLAKWSDPGYIQAQARQRLQFAMPGDTVYVVVDHGQENDIDRTTTKPASSDRGAGWNTKLWDSVARADAG
jgi:cell division protein FtsB